MQGVYELRQKVFAWGRKNFSSPPLALRLRRCSIALRRNELTERWDEKALDSLNSLQMSVSNALLDYQRCPDKARLETQTARLMKQLEVQIRLMPVATPPFAAKSGRNSTDASPDGAVCRN